MSLLTLPSIPSSIISSALLSHHIYNNTVAFWLRVIQFRRSILTYTFSSTLLIFPYLQHSREGASVAAPPASLSGREEVLTSSHLLVVLHDPSPLLHPLTHISTYLPSHCKQTTGFNVQRLGWGLQASRSSNSVMVHEGGCVCALFRACSFAFG